MLTADSLPDELTGTTDPRIAPPVPIASLVKDYRAAAKGLRIKLLAWQDIAARYLTATGPHGWLYPEVAIVVGRQNGKTEILSPRIVMDLKAGRKVIHTAQNRTLPRKVFVRVAQSLKPTDVVSIRYANGQEEIVMRNGGSYVIVAPQRGARGLSGDTLIFDEVREFEEFDIVAAASPTLTASRNPQTIYLSNAGSDRSVVLNDLRRRSETADGTLAYLEWSASPERAIDDRIGWAEANPSLGHFPHMLRFLEKQRASLPVAEFETEHLCRWVASMQPRLVSDVAWMLCQGRIEGDPVRPSMGINMNPDGKRASAVMAWQLPDGRIACVELQGATFDGPDGDLVERYAKDLRASASKHGVRMVSFGSWTDSALAKAFPRAKALDGKEFANASENFARLIQQGRLVWQDADHITDELNWTARKPHDSGAWSAVPATPDTPVTTVLAAIRAVWFPSLPKSAVPRIG